MISMRFTAIIAILTGLSFFGGIFILFVLNPQTFHEFNNLSLASYNIRGMSGRLWAAFVLYGITGFLNIFFCISLLKVNLELSLGLAGKILLMVCGMLWLSFGISYYDFTNEFANHLLLIRLIVLIILSFVSFFLVSNANDLVSQDKILKWFTLLCAALILALSILSTFVYNDDTWIRTNLSIVTYFSWFLIFGFRTYFSR